MNMYISFVNLILKSLFVTILFGIFSYYCALPSLKKYLKAGVLVQKVKIIRRIQDSPSITLCARQAWKTKYEGNISSYSFAGYCNFTADLEQAVECFNKQTLNLSEIIKDEKLPARENVVSIENRFWKETIFDSAFGRF